MSDLTKSFGEIFNLGLPLAIHKSQRPYVWDEDKVNRLIEDLEDFKKRCEEKKLTQLSYYMSTIVLYKSTEDEKKLEIIDGQQRITTLLLLDYFANDAQSVLRNNPKSVILQFNSNISEKNIRTIKTYLKSQMARVLSVKEIIKDRLVFTVVQVDSEDEAFTYFDTQNNRGKKPSIDVVLKAVHLRGITNDEELQKVCAEKWENIENYAKKDVTVPGDGEGFLYPFIKHILWRSRAWKFKEASFANDAKIENTFSRRLSTTDNNNIRFYAHNSIFDVREFQDEYNKKTDASETPEFLIPDETERLPFQLRQPLNKGLEFFLYLEKYASIYKYLFADEGTKEDTELDRFRAFYKKIYSGHSSYMRQYYILCMMMYYDKFKEKGLLNFALALDYMVGAERISSYYIFAVKYVNLNNDFNVLDAIQMAFSPQEVINFIIKNETISTKKIGSLNKIITAYIYELKHYYDRGTKKPLPYKITDEATGNPNEVTKIDLMTELNALVDKRKEWLLTKIRND